MLSEAIIWSIVGIIAISFVFCCCSFCCDLVFQFIVSEEIDDVQPEMEAWEAKHYYDPLPLSTPSPPDTICKPTPYSFKISQNGNGVYAASLPHAVINPAVLQYPPGHVLDQQHVAPPAQQKPVPQKEKSRRHSQPRSRTPSPSPRRAKNVWSTDVDFHRPPNNYTNHHNSSHPSHHHHHHHQNHSHLQHFKEFQQQQKLLEQQYKQQQPPAHHHEDQSQQQRRHHQHHPPAYHEESTKQKHQHKHNHHQPPEYEYDES